MFMEYFIISKGYKHFTSTGGAFSKCLLFLL